MLLVMHVGFAILSIVFALFSLLFPSKLKLYGVYFMTLLTVVSGVALTVSTHAAFGKFCVNSLVYLGVIIAITNSVRQRLVIIQAKN